MKNDPRRSFWRAAGPLLGFWGIQLVMEFVIEFIIILPFMGEASSRMTQSGEVLNYQEMMNIMRMPSTLTIKCWKLLVKSRVR